MTEPTVFGQAGFGIEFAGARPTRAVAVASRIGRCYAQSFPVISGPHKLTWREHATPDELARIYELKDRRQDASAEIKQIYERCRKRMTRGKQKQDKENLE